MDQNDHQAIQGLFAKLSAVEQQSGPRDPEAERFINDQVSSQPGAPYFMAQTIVVQEQALAVAQQRIEQLERQGEDGGSQQGGFLSGILGGGAPQGSSRSGGTVPSAGRPSPWGQKSQANAPMQGRGGGFLAGAAQTAMGVAGGVLLGNAIAGMFGGDEAKAAEAPAAPETAEEPAADENDAGGGGIFGFEE